MMRSVLNWSRSVDRDNRTTIEETYGRFDIVEMPNSGGAGPEGFFYSLHSRASTCHTLVYTYRPWRIA